MNNNNNEKAVQKPHMNYCEKTKAKEWEGERSETLCYFALYYISPSPGENEKKKQEKKKKTKGKKKEKETKVCISNKNKKVTKKTKKQNEEAWTELKTEIKENLKTIPFPALAPFSLLPAVQCRRYPPSLGGLSQTEGPLAQREASFSSFLVRRLRTRPSLDRRLSP